jgi:RNA polymerase sigma-70 factor (ECF subfamily)
VALRIIRNRSLAEEILQEAFIQIWRGAGSFDRARGSGRGWIYTVVRHRALQELRKGSRSPELVSLDAGNEGEAASAVPDRLDAVEANQLKRCLDQLEPEKRDCIVLAYVEGFTHSEIATKIGAPIGTVKSWVRRGLLALRSCLS